jgi:hypothetical protein
MESGLKKDVEDVKKQVLNNSEIMGVKLGNVEQVSDFIIDVYNILILRDSRN